MLSQPLVRGIWPVADSSDAKGKTCPAKPAGGPVLIHDCIAPVSGTTVLHLLWARWAGELGED